MGWQNERLENMVHVHEREEARCALQAAEDAGELDHYWWDRPTDRDEREWEADGVDEGFDDE